MCDHPTEQACDLESVRSEIERILHDRCDAITVTADRDPHGEEVARIQLVLDDDVVQFKAKFAAWLDDKTGEAKFRTYPDDCDGEEADELLWQWLFWEAIQSMRALQKDRDSLHAELVKVRLALAGMEAERNRLQNEVQGWERLADQLATKASEEACEAVKQEFFRFDVKERLLTAERDHAREILSRVSEFARGLEQKSQHALRLSDTHEPAVSFGDRLAHEAAIYESEARSLREILEGR